MHKSKALAVFALVFAAVGLLMPYELRAYYLEDIGEGSGWNSKTYIFGFEHPNAKLSFMIFAILGLILIPGAPSKPAGKYRLMICRVVSLFMIFQYTLACVFVGFRKQVELGMYAHFISVFLIIQAIVEGFHTHSQMKANRAGEAKP